MQNVSCKYPKQKLITVWGYKLTLGAYQRKLKKLEKIEQYNPRPQIKNWKKEV